MLTIPTTATPSQIIQTNVGGQSVVINLYQKDKGLFADIIYENITAVSAVVCRDAVPLIGADYIGFSGNFMIVDTQGSSDPDYSGLGDRYQMVYLTAEEYALV